MNERKDPLRIGLVSYRCENRNIAFNLSQIRRALREARGKADLLCFGEAFLQGFDALSWTYEADRTIAVERDSEAIRRIRGWTDQYGTAVLLGYIERDGDALYSSCIVIAEGEILHNYRRITKGWKEWSRTDAHYREGDTVRPFRFRGRDITIALCGDLWDAPERFRTEQLLIWPVYVNFTPEEWEREMIGDYARQAALAAPEVLMVNPLDDAPKNHGGAFRFRNGSLAERTPFDQERILFVSPSSFASSEARRSVL